MRRLSVLLVLAAVLVSHYAYYLWPDLTRDRQSAKYVGDGLGFALLCALVMWRESGVGAPMTAVAAWGALEGLQQFGCGLATWAQPARAGDLCLQLVGPLPYVVVAAILAAGFLTPLLRAKDG